MNPVDIVYPVYAGDTMNTHRSRYCRRVDTVDTVDIINDTVQTDYTTLTYGCTWPPRTFSSCSALVRSFSR